MMQLRSRKSTVSHEHLLNVIFSECEQVSVIQLYGYC